MEFPSLSLPADEDWWNVGICHGMCQHRETKSKRGGMRGRVKPHGIFIPAEEWWNGGIFPRMCQHRNRDGERERGGGDISCGICLLKNDGRVESVVECVSTEKKANIPDGFFSAEEGGGNLGIFPGMVSTEREGEREGGDIPHGICLLMNDGMVESATECVSTKRDRRGGWREAGENVFLHDRIFLGFWQRMLDPELCLLRNWERVRNWVAVSFFEASTKTSVGSSDSQRISCASKSAAGIVVDGAHTNSRHWNCGPWRPPLGSRPLCKQLAPISLFPPLEKNKFCKLLSSSCKNAP